MTKMIGIKSMIDNIKEEISYAMHGYFEKSSVSFVLEGTRDKEGNICRRLYHLRI